MPSRVRYVTYNYSPVNPADYEEFADEVEARGADPIEILEELFGDEEGEDEWDDDDEWYDDEE